MSEALQLPDGRRIPGLGGLLVATASFRGTQNMAQTTMSLLARSLGLTSVAIGALAAYSNLVSVVVMFLVSTRIPPGSSRRAVGAGSLLLVGALMLFSASSVPLLWLAALLLGAAGGLALPAMATSVSHWARVESRQRTERPSARHTPGDANRPLMLFGLVLSASLMVGPLLESGVLSLAHQHLRVAFVVFLTPALIGIAAPRPIRRPEGGDDPRPEGPRFALGVLFKNHRAALAMCAQALYSVPFAVVVVFGALIGKNLFHKSASFAALAIALFFATSLVARGSLAIWPVREGRARIFALCVVATLLGLALLASAHSGTGYLVALALLGVPHGFTYPLSLALLAEAVPRHELARTNASFTAVSTLVNIGGPLLLGIVAGAGGFRTMIWCAALPVLGLASVLFHLRDAEVTHPAVA
jgi:MFS transporter, DHA1 family, multidrug resistance protein